MHLHLKFFIFIQLVLSTCILIPCTAKSVESQDQMGNITLTHLNDNDQIRSIESYSKTQNGELQLLCIEHFEWHPLFPALLIERSIEDNQGNTLISQTLSYDEQGRLTEEIMRNHEDAPFYIRHSYDYNEAGRLRTTTLETDDSSTLPEIALKAGCLDNPRGWFDSIFPSLKESFCQECDFFLRMSGESADPAEACTFPGIEVSDNVRITYTNGIMNNKNDLLETVKWISEIHNGINIHYVFRPSEGWAWDILKSSLVRLGIIPKEAYALAETWKRLIAEMGGTDKGNTIIHYAHSMGGTNTNAAKSLMTPEELKMIQAVIFGSPTIVSPGGFQSVINYISVRDGVLFLDPIGRIKALFSDNSHIVYVGNFYGIPLADHFITNSTYRTILKDHAKAFIEEYCPLDIMPRLEIADQELDASTLSR